MTLARVGIAVALVGAVALVVHVRFRARLAQQRSDCAAWRRAEDTIVRAVRDVDLEGHWDWRIWGLKPEKLIVALDDPDDRDLWKARQLFVSDPQLTFELLPVLRDPRRAGRASWLLKQATGRDAPIVGAETNLDELARDWEEWLDGLDGGAMCRRLAN
jgi:hypothetical protein